MDAIAATARTTGPLPPGTPAPSTENEKALWEQAKQFEAVFVRQLVSQMLEAARGESSSPSSAIHQNMADEQMTGSLVESGAFGLAGSVYGFLRTQANAVPLEALGAALPAGEPAAEPIAEEPPA
jgi:Rod binding domain-containing protein